MEFVHKSYEKGKTIAAVATPPGEGGIAVIRVSGNDSLTIANKIFSGDVFSYQSHTAHYGKILTQDATIIDEVLLLVMKAPRSFTGEDTVEIHCHGGMLVTKNVLERVLQAGAEPALPGEFSFQAFMNGKMDLTQAEAIQALIAAKNNKALRSAKEHLQGLLKDKISNLQNQLSHITAIFEAWVDYPEEGLEFASYEDISSSLTHLAHELDQLCSSYHDGKILKEGLRLCLLGSPNVGKSSLMNALSGRDRAIVTNIPGTTRDVLDEELRLGDLHFTLTDTAGIRTTDEIIEQEGIRRSFLAAENSDLILFVIDITKGLNEDETALIATLPPHKTLLIWNKTDEQTITHINHSNLHQAYVSAKTGDGLEKLKGLIRTMVWKQDVLSNDQILITNQRHYQALTLACHYLKETLHGLSNNHSPELLSMDMKAALKELGTVIGTNVTEDILNAIFSTFCVGK